jgi:hypothetical protein
MIRTLRLNAISRFRPFCFQVFQRSSNSRPSLFLDVH